MLNAIHGVKLYAQCYTRSEAICSLLYMERSNVLITIHGAKLYADCYTWREAYTHFYTWSEALHSLL